MQNKKSGREPYKRATTGYVNQKGISLNHSEQENSL
jgi:hypothetical protein